MENQGHKKQEPKIHSKSMLTSIGATYGSTEACVDRLLWELHQGM